MKKEATKEVFLREYELFIEFWGDESVRRAEALHILLYMEDKILNVLNNKGIEFVTKTVGSKKNKYHKRYQYDYKELLDLRARIKGSKDYKTQERKHILEAILLAELLPDLWSNIENNTNNWGVWRILYQFGMWLDDPDKIENILSGRSHHALNIRNKESNQQRDYCINQAAKIWNFQLNNKLAITRMSDMARTLRKNLESVARQTKLDRIA